MGTQVFKINPDGSTTEIKSERPIKDVLKTEDCYVVVADEYHKVYLWKGIESNVRSKFNGAKLVHEIRSQVGLKYAVIVLDEGEEEPDFLKLIEGKTEGGIAKEIKKKAFSEPSPQNTEVFVRKRFIRARRKLRGSDDDRYPYPYVFKPPEPPDDIVVAPGIQLHTSPKKKVPEEKIHCQYCGRELTEEEQLTHSCKKRPKNK